MSFFDIINPHDGKDSLEEEKELGEIIEIDDLPNEEYVLMMMEKKWEKERYHYGFQMNSIVYI